MERKNFTEGEAEVLDRIMTRSTRKEPAKKTVKKPAIDEEFRRVAESLLRKDRKLLERLAKI